MSPQPARSSLFLIALAGLVSGPLSLATTFLTRADQFAIGLTFGIVLAVYFAAYERFRSPAQLAGFVAACTAAYFVAVLSAVALLNVFPGHADMGSPKLDIPLPVFFGAGWLGAFIVLTAGLLLFVPSGFTWPSLARSLFWSIGGGILGVIGGFADSLRTKGTFRTMYLLHLIWQPGAALLLGLFLRRERKRAAAAPSTAIAAPALPATAAQPPARNLRIVSVLFFAAVLAFLGFAIYRSVQFKLAVKRRTEAYNRYLAEAPPIPDQLRLEPVPLDQALVLHEIDGLYPWLPSSNSSARSSVVLPPAVNYRVGYSSTKDPPPYPTPNRIIAVDITQLPTAAWARYRVKYPFPNIAIDDPQSLTGVQKFGQTIVQDSSRRYPDGNGTLCFHWPSGSFAVSVCYESPKVDEEFLRQYLNRYPSSL